MIKAIVVFFGALLAVLQVFSADVPLWGRFETSVANPNTYDNPFTDVVLNAVFTRPDGATVDFFGFYDGDGKGGQTGNVWKLRFMPDQLGTWSYTSSFSDGTPGASGEFTCTAAGAKPGPLRPDPSNRRWFQFADGTRKHLHGYYYLDFWSDFEETWNKVLSDIVLADEYTLIMPMSYIRGTSTTGELGQPIQRTYAWLTSDSTVLWDRFDLATWKRLDSRLEWASNHNLVVYTFDGLFPNTSYGAKVVPPDKQDFYIRYTVARHAPYWNVMWNTCAECWKLYTPAQVKAWAEKVRDLDPWKHPTSWHDQGQGARLTASERSAWNHSGPPADYAVLQNEYRNARPAYNFVVENHWNKPVHACETTWEELDGQLGKPRNRTEVRRAIWGISLATAISLYADWTSDYDPAKGLNTRHLGFGKGRPDVRRMNRFLSGLPWWTMEPHAELVSDPDDVCMAAVGQRYVVYSESGATISLNLAAGAYEGEWFNPVEGATPATLPIAQFSWPGEELTFRCPTAGDWVLHIRNTEGGGFE